MTPAEGAVIVLTVATTGGAATAVVAVEGAGLDAGVLAGVMLALLGLVTSVVTWLLKRESWRHKREERKNDQREASQQAQADRRDELLRTLIDQHGKTVEVLQQLSAQLADADLARSNAVHELHAKLDALPGRIHQAGM